MLYKIMMQPYAGKADPWLIHRLMYRQTMHRNLHVRDCREGGTTTTAIDIVVLNDFDRVPSAVTKKIEQTQI